MASDPERDVTHGDCFVIMSGTGLFWSGAEWVEKWAEALQFTSPPLRDPWLACHQAAESLEQSTGLYCTVAFVPRRGVSQPRERPD
jgi:hypothetical protein